jgi:3-oxoacyl-[acyl-carrier-protein] synthase II
VFGADFRGERAMGKVVITGLAVISAAADNLDEFWANMLQARSGIARISRFDPTEYRTQIAAEIKSNISTLLGYSVANLSLNSQFALACAAELVKDAGLADPSLDKRRIGISLGTGLGGMYYTEEALTRLIKSGPTRVNPMTVPFVDPNSIVNQIAIKWGFVGQQHTIATACSSSANAMGIALDMIRSGRVDRVVTGGVEATITPLMVAGFDRLRAMSSNNDNPENSCRPFATDRDGFVLGEGAAMLVLEKESAAKARGAKIYAELAGFGSTGGGFHAVMPIPDGNDSALAMQLALADANLSAADIDLVNPHGTGTKLNDAAEYNAMKLVFGERVSAIHMSPTKQLTGHLLGAAGALEAVHAVKSLQTQTVTPFKKLDDEFGLHINYSAPIPAKLSCAMSNSFAFGNNNVSLVFKK